MKEDKGVFLKVDCVEPDFELCPSPLECSRINGIKVWINGNGHLFECDHYTVCDPDVVREDGYRQAFALMKTIYDMSGNERKEAFGKVFFGEILKGANYDDLAKKLDAWKEEKEAIHVKDEVQHKLNGEKAVVLNVMDGFIYAVTKKKAFITCAPVGDYKKTGVHVDDLDAYLEV